MHQVGLAGSNDSVVALWPPVQPCVCVAAARILRLTLGTVQQWLPLLFSICWQDLDLTYL